MSFNYRINEDAYREDGELRKKSNDNIIVVSIASRHGDLQGKAS